MYTCVCVCVFNSHARTHTHIQTHTHTHLCRWAMAEGYGCHLIKHPEVVTDMVSQAHRRSRLPVSIKIRVHSDLR